MKAEEKVRTWCGWVLFLAVALLVLAACAQNPVPLERAHSHNDYMRPHPLFDALAAGFCSVEADIYLVNGELLVAHDRDKVKPGETLQKLYLDPLSERVRKNKGRVYPNGPTVTLLIDFKDDPQTTYPKLREVLKRYEEMLTVFSNDSTEPRAVTVILSGNSPRRILETESPRFAAIDGRLPDLETSPSPHLVPLISDTWPIAFTWRGNGPMPEGERTKLREMAAKAHAHGQRIRFYGTPQQPAVWAELYAAGVDLLNADNPAGMREFLLNEMAKKTPR